MTWRGTCHEFNLNMFCLNPGISLNRNGEPAHVYRCRWLDVNPCFPGPWSLKNSSIDSGEAEVGRRVTQEVPPGVFWRSQIHISQPQFLKFNISLGKDALFGVYIRRGLPPSHAQVWPCLIWPWVIVLKIHTHFTPSTVAIIKGRTITSIGRDVEILEHWYLATLVHCYWEFEMVQPPWKRVWQFFKKLHVELPYNPVILPLGMYPQRIENIISHKNIHTNVIAALFGITPKWKPPKCPWLTNG